MRGQWRSSFERAVRAASLAAAACGATACSAPDGSTPAAVDTADPPGAAIPRAADGKPKLDGIWQALADASWDIRPHAADHPALAQLGAAGAIPPGLGIVEGGEIPYQSWAADKQRENFADRLSLDPEVKCYLPGVPRATYMQQPFQILQTADYVMIAYQYAGAVRTVHMNDPGPAPAESWMGWSRRPLGRRHAGRRRR